MKRLWAAIGSGILFLGVAGAPRAPSVVWEQTGEPWIDQDHVVAVHRHRVAEVGETWEDFWRAAREHMLWPEDETFAKLSVPAERTAEARAECVRQVGVVLKPEYLPAELEGHLVGISGYGANGSHFLLARYRTGRWRIQIIYSGLAVGILAVPREASPGKPPLAKCSEYALKTAKALLVSPRPEDLPYLTATAGLALDELVHGSIVNPNAMPTGSLVGASPWYGIDFITDGNHVFLCLPTWGLYEDTDIRTAGMPAHLPPLDKPILLFEPERAPQ